MWFKPLFCLLTLSSIVSVLLVSCTCFATVVIYIYIYLDMYLSGTIIRGTLKTPNSQLVTPISIKLQRPDGCD
jgi:hypothetical protein